MEETSNLKSGLWVNMTDPRRWEAAVNHKHNIVKMMIILVVLLYNDKITILQTIPKSSSDTTLETKPALKASSALIGKPVSSMWAETFRGTHLTSGMPGVEQNMPTLPLKKMNLLWVLSFSSIPSCQSAHMVKVNTGCKFVKCKSDKLCWHIQKWNLYFDLLRRLTGSFLVLTWVNH